MKVKIPVTNSIIGKLNGANIPDEIIAQYAVFEKTAE